jgi:hypothetical protein
MIVYLSITVEENKTYILAVPQIKIKMENENRRKEEKFREIERTKKNLQKSKILGNKIIP